MGYYYYPQSMKFSFLGAKQLLPTYGVFYDQRHFSNWSKPIVWEFNNKRIGITICEDMWNTNQGDIKADFHYKNDPISQLGELNIDLCLNISASPFTIGKRQLRRELASSISQYLQCPLIVAAQVGGNDEVVFDGHSMALNESGELIYESVAFEESSIAFDLNKQHKIINSTENSWDILWKAMRLGLKDYVEKSGFTQVVIGLSGGIDSAMVAILAADALGPHNVSCIALPSRYSSDHSL